MRNRIVRYISLLLALLVIAQSYGYAVTTVTMRCPAMPVKAAPCAMMISYNGKIPQKMLAMPCCRNMMMQQTATAIHYRLQSPQCDIKVTGHSSVRNVAANVYPISAPILAERTAEYRGIYCFDLLKISYPDYIISINSDSTFTDNPLRAPPVF